MNYPHDDLSLFLEAVQATQRQKQFIPRLIEKDYFCTLILMYLSKADPGLVFKGGTCLAKVHADFYRLSEDLDFSIPVPDGAPRSLRKKSTDKLKQAMGAITDHLTFLKLDEPLVGANNSTQYNALVSYASCLTGDRDTIKIEVALREPLLEPPQIHYAKTLLINPITREPYIAPVPLSCISFVESFSEKIRAALTRRQVAIRDFFDIDYATRRLGLVSDDPRLIDMVRKKLLIPGTLPPDASELRLAPLNNQVRTQLRAVLKQTDFDEFDLDRAVMIVRACYTAINVQ